MPTFTEAMRYTGDWQILARQLSPTEAYLLVGALHAAQIPASVGDTELVQMHGLLAPAMGGAMVRVPSERLDDAHALMQALQNGDLALGEDWEEGGAV